MSTILDARAPDKPAGILVDTATMQRIPFAYRVDFATGEWEAYKAAPNGIDILCDANTGQPIVVKGKSRGKLILESLHKAVQFGVREPEPVRARIEPMSKEERKEGLNEYKRVYFQVWNEFRGESRRCVGDRWSQFLTKSTLFDSFVIRRDQ